MKLLVRNLARGTSEGELRTKFEAFGAVQSCALIIDKASGLSKGFGFVDMPKHGDAKAAMKSLNGSDLDGQKIRVKKQKPKSPADDAGPVTPDA
ncbi:MAG: RNA-binding protein [Gammaproteobacteria bacterium]|nr:RNA-binding protein [Gammaproteobacteria bacterium]